MSDSDVNPKPRTLPPPPRKRRRRWRKLLIALGVLLIVAYFSYVPLISRLIGSKLRDAVASRLHADLQYDSLTYVFPYQVRVKNLRLLADPALGGTELLCMEQLNLELARLPLPHRPIVVRNLDLQKPTVRLVRTDAGIAGSSGLKRRPDEPTARPPSTRLSEMFELRRFAIHDGSVVYENRAITGAQPMAFRGITVDLGVTPKSAAVYAYQLSTTQPPFVQIDASGTMDIDAMLLEMTKVAMSVQSKRVDGESSLPARLQQIVNNYGIAGTIGVAGSANLPLRDLSGASFAADLSISDAKASLPKRKSGLDQLNARLHVKLQAGEGQIELAELYARSGATRLTFQKAAAQLNRQGWKLDDLEGLVETIAAGAETPPAPEGELAVLGGTATINATASGDFGSPAEYSLAIHPSELSILPPGFANPITNLSGEIRIGNDSIEFWNVQGEILGGQAQTRGTVQLARPVAYDIDVTGSGLDLAEFANMPAMNGKVSKFAGRANLNGHLRGDFPIDGSSALDRLAVKGKLEVTEGEFWKSTWLSDVAELTGISGDALTLGEAAAIFSIEQRVITFKRAAINSSVLGIQGKGKIGFDGIVDLDLIAAPLGDWREHIQQTRIPLVSNFAGQLAGQLQKMVQAATSNLLYEFEVKGKLPRPQVKPVPAPILTDTAANLFGKMLQGLKSSELLKSLEE